MTRIVIADDQEMVRHGFRMILDAQPDMHVVGEAADGARAVETVRTLRPDVLLADIRMPVENGLEVVRELASDTVKVVVVTRRRSSGWWRPAGPTPRSARGCSSRRGR